MPTLKTPLFGSYNNRSFAAVSGKDQFFKGCILTPIANAMTRSAAYYVEKRGGCTAQATPESGSSGHGIFYSPSTQIIYSLFFGASGLSLYSGTTACGVVCATSGADKYFWECEIGGVTYILLTVNDGSAYTAWYLPSDAVSPTAYTCDGNNSTTITDIKVSGVNSVAGLYVGQKLTAATNIVAGSRIVSINAGAFSAVLDTATTGGAFNDLATTKEPIAKIIDADLPSDIVGALVEMDGYLFIGTKSGKVYNSDLNTPASWSASNFLTTSKYADKGTGVYRYKNLVVAFGSASLEFFYNAGNASGSPLSSSSNAIYGKAIGTATAGAPVCAAHDTIYWVANDGNIYTLEGYSAKKITAAGTAISGHYVQHFFYNKKSYLNLTSHVQSAKQYWYSIDDNLFIEPSLGDGKASYASNEGYFVFSYIFVSLDTSGKTYKLSTSSFQDNGSAFTMSVQIGTDMGTQKRKIYKQLRLLADVQASGTLDVSWSDDDGATYTTARGIPLTDINQMFLTRLGSGEGNRLWKFEHSANTAMRIKGIEIDYDVVAT